jgi:hypothetical protein
MVRADFSAQFFLTTVKARPLVRQISSPLISKGKSRDSNFTRLRQLSPTIGRFFRLVDHAGAFCARMKKTVSAL